MNVANGIVMWIMAQSRSKTRKPMTFSRLMRLGQVAHSEGDKRSAHAYWQKAAMLEPDNEQVWTALMWVIDDDEDRIICLKNIMALNPDNLQAREMLDNLIGETQPQTEEKEIIADVAPEEKRGIDHLRVVLLGSILGTGTAISLSLLQMIFS